MKQNKLEVVSKAYTTMMKGEKEICIIDTDVVKNMGDQNAIMDIQHSLDTEFEISYQIMADACDIIASKTLDGKNRDGLNADDCDFYADADSRANVYTGVQLSYLSVKNEGEISDLMKDEAITSIAHACSVWYTQKVVEACMALRSYINA